jgi:tetratricopeptide (TPR) repeat protein
MFKISLAIIMIAGHLMAADAPGVKPAAQTPPPAPPAAVGYAKEFSPKSYKSEDCLQKSNVESCLKLAAIKKNENNIKEALPLARKACELKAEACSGLFAMANILGADAVANLKKFLEEQCVKNADACNEASLIYESQKDYTTAIDYARKYYLKYQKGNFTKFSYQYGDKNEAFAASLNECTKNNADCVGYIRFMPDHPQIAKMITLAEQDCVKSPTGTSCLDTGLHYNKKAKYAKAYQLWGPSCKSSIAEACIFIMGSRGIEPEEQLDSYRHFCKISSQMPIGFVNVKKMNCQSPSSAKDIPNQLKAYSEYELRKAEKSMK